MGPLTCTLLFSEISHGLKYFDLMEMASCNGWGWGRKWVIVARTHNLSFRFLQRSQTQNAPTWLTVTQRASTGHVDEYSRSHNPYGWNTQESQHCDRYFIFSGRADQALLPGRWCSVECKQFQTHQHQTGPLCDRDRSRQEHDHSTIMTEHRKHEHCPNHKIPNIRLFWLIRGTAAASPVMAWASL